MSESVLVVPTAVLVEAGSFHGFTDRVEHYLPRVLDSTRLSFLPRDEAEDDAGFKQLIPYLVLKHGGRFFCYKRRKGGEKRLDARLSLGIGGHVCDLDGATGRAAYDAGMRRELAEEVEIGEYTGRIIGLINDERSPVGMVHLGIVHLLELREPRVAAREASLAEGAFASLAELRRRADELESWSRFLLDVLEG